MDRFLTEEVEDEVTSFMMSCSPTNEVNLGSYDIYVESLSEYPDGMQSYMNGHLLTLDLGVGV